MGMVVLVAMAAPGRYNPNDAIGHSGVSRDDIFALVWKTQVPACQTNTRGSDHRAWAFGPA